VKGKISRLIDKTVHFQCEMCGKIVKRGPRYEYQNHSFVEGHIPKHYKSICRICIYKESYGSKNASKRMKEGILDENTRH
tara:strand:+ start:1954 stop:2193 length:240 start_codon:yes stop_codon:yes gene_type:complete